MAPVAFMFEKKGLITIDPSKSSRTFDELFEAAVEAGAEDVQETEGEEGPEWAVSRC
jgi:transcriptional/translational regulatory protein YebC/TACO1